MPVNSERRDNAQTTILALLLSQKGGCTLQQLCKDYYEEEGESVPWKELGYVSLLSFIHSMSKVVQVENRSGTIFVKGVASDKSKHVSKLVAGQKDKRTDTRKSYRPSHYYPNTVPQKVRIPVEVLAEIVSLVDLHPEGVNMDYVFNEVRRHMPFVNISLIDLIEQIQALSHKIFVAHNKVFPIRSKSNCLAKLNDTNMYLPESRSMVSNEGELESVVVTAGGNEDSYIMNNYDEEYDCEFLPSGYVNSTPYTKSSAKAKPTSNFIQETVSKQYDNNVEHKFTEHDSRVHTDQNTAYDMFKCNNTDNAQAYMQFSNNVDEENETYLYGKNVETLISDRVKIRLEKLIQNHSNGIWCADLPAKYLEEYRVPLNYMELGFSSVREFTSHLPEIFHCVQPRDAEDFILYDAKKEILANSTKEQHPVVTLAELHQIYPTDDEIEPIPTTVSLNTCQELIPDNVMTIGETVGYLSVTSLVPEEKPYIEVFVVEVFTPSFFWIQLRKKQRKFKNFMDDLHNFYTMNHEQYVIPSVVLEKGLNCACVYNKIWHRGIIKTVNHDLQVTVMFYDYGTLKTYPPEAIRYLHKRFSPLSAQAIPCGLINTKCYNGSKWSRSATHAFAVRTSHVPLIATVASTNIEDNSMMVTLTDTLGDEDVHINDWLVERKLAKHGKMIDNVDLDNLLLYIEENLLFEPDKCYNEETDVTINKIENSVENSEIPLVSPESILFENSSKTSAEITEPTKVPDEQIVAEEAVPESSNHVPENDTNPPATPPKNTNTNASFQDPPTNELFNGNITSQQLMKLWSENLQAQMNITASIIMLWNRITLKSLNNVADTSSTTVPSIMSNYLQNPNIYQDFTNLGHPGYPVSTTMDPQIALHAAANSEQLNPDNDFGATDPSAADQAALRTKTRVPPGFETVFSAIEDPSTTADASVNAETPLKETNPFKLSLAGKLKIDSPEESSADSASVMQRNLESVDPDTRLNRFDNEATPDKFETKSSGADISEILYKNTLMNNPKYFFTNAPSVADNVDNDVSTANGKSFPYDHAWDMDHVTNNTSNITVNQGVGRAKGTQEYNYSFESFPYNEINSPECPKKQEQKNNFIFESPFLPPNGSGVNHNTEFGEKVSNKDYGNIFAPSKEISQEYGAFPSNCKSRNSAFASWLPHCSSPDDSNVDEGYFTRPSTSRTTRSSSSLGQFYNLPLLYENFNGGMSAESWIQSAANNIAEFNNKKSALENYQESGIEDAAVFAGRIENNLPSERADVFNDLAHWKSAVVNKIRSSSIYPATSEKLFFQVIELFNRPMLVFHYKEEGWLLTEEFVHIFTTFQTVSNLMSLLHKYAIPIPFEEIDKTVYPVEFYTLTSTFEKVEQDVVNGLTKLHLISLRSAYKVLTELKIIPQMDITDAFIMKKYVNGSITHKIMVVVNAYIQFKNSIDCRE